MVTKRQSEVFSHIGTHLRSHFLNNIDKINGTSFIEKTAVDGKMEVQAKSS